MWEGFNKWENYVLLFWLISDWNHWSRYQNISNNIYIESSGILDILFENGWWIITLPYHICQKVTRWIQSRLLKGPTPVLSPLHGGDQIQTKYRPNTEEIQTKYNQVKTKCSKYNHLTKVLGINHFKKGVLNKLANYNRKYCKICCYSWGKINYSNLC